MRLDDFLWLNTSTEEAARRLLGCELWRQIDGREVRVKIVETEAYDQSDEASHAFRGKTARNKAMFKSAGHLYVYFTYGMHYCCNVVCGPEGYGSGALIRAVEPLDGIDIIEQLRKVGGVNMTNGPAKVCQALDIDRRFSGHDLAESPIRLIERPALPETAITISRRVGISRAVDELRRFYITDNPFVSRA